MDQKHSHLGKWTEIVERNVLCKMLRTRCVKDKITVEWSRSNNKVLEALYNGSDILLKVIKRRRLR